MIADIFPIGDDAISIAVRTRLQIELGLTHPVVRATIVNGVVTLGGRLECAAKREAAKVVAESVRGVRRVVNDISTAQYTASRLRSANEQSRERRAACQV